MRIKPYSIEDLLDIRIDFVEDPEGLLGLLEGNLCDSHFFGCLQCLLGCQVDVLGLEEQIKLRGQDQFHLEIAIR